MTPPPTVPQAGLDGPRLAAWGALALQLHRGSRQWSARQFPQRSAELIQELLPHDGLWCGCGLTDPPPPADAPHGAAPDATTPVPGQGSWLSLMRSGHWPCGAPGDDDDTSPAPQLQAVQTEPADAAVWVLALRRAHGGAAFTPADAAALTFILPHLVEAWRECELAELSSPAARAPTVGHAVASADGLLRLSDARFLTLMRLEWPYAARHQLPDAWRTAAAEAAAQSPDAAALVQVGRRVVAQLQPHPGGGVQIRLRPRSALDALTPRRREIVRRYAAGQTGPQIARALGLSESTVNNHLGAIFKQLGVQTKLQLRALVDAPD